MDRVSQGREFNQSAVSSRQRLFLLDSTKPGLRQIRRPPIEGSKFDTFYRKLLRTVSTFLDNIYPFHPSNSFI